MKRSTKKKMRRMLGLSMAVAMTMTSVPEGKLYDWHPMRVQAADTTKTIDASATVQQVESAASNRPGVPDGILLNKLKELVNGKLGREASHEITFSELMSYDGEIDLSGIGSQLTSINGLGYARRASKIILTNVPIKVIDDYEFDGCTGLKEIVLPTSLEKIGKMAFRGCISLEKIELPQTIRTIGESAFNSCVKIKNINIPDQIEVIEKSAFSSCEGLREIKIVNPKVSLGASVFEGCVSLWKAELPEGMEEIPVSFFSQTGLTSIKLPSTIKIIKQSAFNTTVLLEKIDLTGCTGLTTLETSAFAASGIKTIQLPNSLTTIKSNCFEASDLEVISIPDSVMGKGDGSDTGIETLAFWNCRLLKKVTLSPGISAISTGMFKGCWKLDDITVRNAENSVLESIESEAFSECYSMTNTDFLKKLPNLKRIEDSAFAYVKITDDKESLKFKAIMGTTCMLETPDIFGETQWALGLKSISLPDSVTYLGKAVFKDQPNVLSVSLGNGLKTIPEKTFYGCSFLKKLTLPSQLKKIEKQAFSGCCRLEDFTLPTTLETIEEEAFRNCGDTKTANGIYYHIRYLKNSDIYTTRPNNMPSVAECLVYEKANEGNHSVGIKFIDTTKYVDQSEYNALSETEKLNYSCLYIIAEKCYAKEDEVYDVKKNASTEYTNYSYDESLKAIVATKKLYVDAENPIFSKRIYEPKEGYVGYFIRGALSNQLHVRTNMGFSTLNIPNGVKTIGKKAFYNCYNLSNITLPEQMIEVPEGAFGLEDRNKVRVYNWLKENQYIWGRNIKNRNVTLPSKLEIIGASAFENNGNLQSIELPQMLSSIGERAFDDCRSMKRVTIPSKVTSIGNYAFWGCSEYRLKDSLGPGNVDDYDLEKGYGLEEIDLTQASSLEEIGSFAFGLTGIKQSVLPEKVKVVPQGLYAYCKELNNVICSNDTDAIKADVFRDATGLVSITVPAKATISYNAFRGNYAGIFSLSVTEPEPYSISIGEDDVLPINTFISDHLRDIPQIKEKNGETGFLENAQGKVENINDWDIYKVGVKGLKEGTTKISVVGTSNYYLHGSKVLTKAPEISITVNVTKKKCKEIVDTKNTVVMSVENTHNETTLKPQLVPADCTEASSWFNTNESIVSVLADTYIENGVKVVSPSAVLYPKELGTSKVTIKTGSVKKDYQVNVVVPATKLTLDKNDVVLKEGTKERIKLNASMTYDTWKYTAEQWENHKDILEYQSADEKIATVSAEGTVTPVGIGTTQITVTALGSGMSQTCQVRVLPDETVVYITDATGTKLSSVSDVKVQAKEPIIVNLATEPVNSLAELTWEFSSSDMFGYVKDTKKYIETEDRGQQEKVIGLEFVANKIGKGTITIYPRNCKNKNAVKAVLNVEVSADTKEVHFAPISEIVVGKEANVFGYLVSNAGKAEKIADIEKVTNDRLSFVSSDSKVATVDEKTGVVKAISAGEVTITAKVENSSDASKNISEDLKLTIVKPDVTGMKLSIKDNKRVVNVGESTQVITEFMPSDAWDKVSYTSDKPEIAKVDSEGKITGVSAGTAKISVTTEKKGITETIEISVTGAAKPQATKKPTTITVKQVSGVKVVNQKGKKIKVSWKKLSDAKGYRVTIALNKKFTSGKKMFTVSKKTIVSKVITKLKKGKTYYVKVEAYKLNGKKKVYSKKITVKSVKIKK